jgi:quercetin dioxygenase-like cupin family protein
MAELPPVRRIVTSHDPNGKAIIASDTTLTPIDPHILLDAPPLPASSSSAPSPVGGGFILLYKTASFPASNTSPIPNLHGTHVPLSDSVGTTVRIVDMPPHLSSPMHRTISLDFGVVLKGEVVLELDDGVETTVKEGEVVVQRGTIHAWHNRTEEMVRVLFVLVPAEKVVLEGGEVIEGTSFLVN